jgi:putative glutamine amidotransferase
VPKRTATANAGGDDVRPPLVGLTTSTATDGRMERARLNTAYIRAVTEAGMIPVLLPPIDPGLAEGAAARLDGLVLTGGEDVDPELFGARPHEALGPVNRARDEWELALARAARHSALPVLAICRGVQVLNVALGGTLVQDIPSERPSSIDHNASSASRGSQAHDVDVVATSRLREVLGAARLAVNSIHHQAIDRVSGELEVVARADDGLIEAAESADRGWWAVGVQWHPEEMISGPDPSNPLLFSAFAAAARAARSAVRG